ncbi:uroporphyrinogen-III C-methyltransferase [Pasteurellaceae bacterium HPA106]|uniref:uroporphyrinogen-III C-methyltransferase n=1 Tax=Spirabiliibacterium pneumoniae TaxID=221400 RepID=UPI001AACC33D|nr:uroporphyrinogen-III C-methyltransferase [Spirabiliibacterium pneumoniae]MBE2897219.1 uroporphyrinogen-III C-methyltransferase [Spirabiliibacterium pneumoniae]
MSDKSVKTPNNRGNQSINEGQNQGNATIVPNKPTSDASKDSNALDVKNTQNHKRTDNRTEKKNDFAGAKTAGTKPADNKAKDSAAQTPKVETPASEPKKVETVKVEKSGGGKGLALLAILIALGVGGAGYYFGMQKYNELHQLIGQRNGQSAVTPAASVELETALSQLKQAQETQAQELASTKAQLEQANEQLKTLSNHAELEKAQNAELRNQLNKLSFNNKTQASDWLMSEADFLLTNAQRKLVLDGDVDTVIALLQDANASLEKVQNSQAVAIRAAINQDINQLQSLNDVDQDLIMSKLSLLISQVDNLKVLSLNPNTDSAEVSDSVDDWQKNLEKSANSFLDHFIRVSKKDKDTPELLAPNQDIYLKENIRMSLQIALAAVPRQQNEVYKQSLDSVATWLRSYFDTEDASVEQFLQQVDQLKEQSIYIDAPAQLNAWKTISTVLNRNNQALENLSASTAKSEDKSAVNRDVSDENKAENRAESDDAKAPEAESEGTAPKTPDSVQ